MAKAQPVHADFKEAYCHHFGCNPAAFERHLLLRIIPLAWRPLAAFSFWLDRELFASELEVIRLAGPAKSGREVNAAAQDLVHLRFVENSFRRSIGMRGRSEAVVALWNEVKGTVVRPAGLDHPTIAFAETATHISAARRSAALGRRDSALTLRTLRKIHQDISLGKPIPQTVEAEGLTEDQLLDLLTRNLKAFAGFAELRDRLIARRNATSNPSWAPAEAENPVPRTRSRSLS